MGWEGGAGADISWHRSVVGEDRGTRRGKRCGLLMSKIVLPLLGRELRQKV